MRQFSPLGVRVEVVIQHPPRALTEQCQQMLAGRTSIELTRQGDLCFFGNPLRG